MVVAQVPVQTGKPARLLAVDALRGLLIVLMALDHANHFVAQQHPSGEYWGGPFPAYHDPLAFLTRLVTHPAAPGFSFLMGVGMALFARSRRLRGWSRLSIVQHFLVRGVTLIALQLLLVNRAWELSPGGWGLALYVGVLVALGGGMILGSLLLWLEPAHLLALFLVLLLGAELLSPSPDRWGLAYSLPISVLLVPAGQNGWWVNYPILQWLELVVLGLVFGHWLTDDPRRAYRRAVAFGGACLIAFAAIRFPDGFGNIRPRAGSNWVDILNVVKYPPSMAFTTLTMAVNLSLLGLFGWASERLAALEHPLRLLAVIGRVPLFFYVTHLFLYAGLGHLLTPAGASIPAMVPYWLLGVLLLFPFCRWYGLWRREQPAHSLLRYL